MGHLTYLVFELVWALPVLVLQCIVGWRELWKERRALLAAVAIATIYLSAADGVAISQGIWTLHTARIIQLKVGVVPVEEIVFFLLTNSMVVQSVILVRAYGNRRSEITPEASTG
jgi:lycopene cyclase domain-containing protein